MARLVLSQLYLHKDTGWIPLKKTVSKLEIEIGLSEGKVRYYLSLLADDDRFEIDDENDKIKRHSE
jgi:hypothetical protein